MKSVDLAEDYVLRANSRLASARAAMRRREYPDVVRYSQECVELALKACLRFVGIDYPREHDVREVLIDTKDRFPKWFSQKIEELGRISSTLALLRGPSVYGEEERGIPPSRLFGRNDASRAISQAKSVFEASCRLVQGSRAISSR